MSKVVHLLLLMFASFFLLNPIINSKAEVITLTADTFNDKVNEKDTAWFVQFCVPWCKHCKNLGTLWEDLGKAMEGEDEIEIGQVDCGTNKEICNKVDIHSYPTFKLFYNGEEAAKYKEMFSTKFRAGIGGGHLSSIGFLFDLLKILWEICS
nr:protein disulfide isomerase-like 5-1 isoform X1 [Coffea arabica]